ncbi:MFS transporter [Lysinibacillus contaminans]|nr:MFS transporter [Lysinibacillus contaminans]
MADAISKNAPMNRWFALGWIAIAELFALSMWFSASAILPQLEKEWGMSAVEGSWITLAVQIGFIVGAIISAFLGLADRFNVKKLFALACIIGALVNGLFILSPCITYGVLFRFLTGITMAGVYPTAVKLLSLWFPNKRGLGTGILVAALTLGSSLPHLLVLFTSNVNWKIIMIISSVLALLAAGIMQWVLPEAPAQPKRAGAISRDTLKKVIRNRRVMLVNCGYFGHMWELYAMWTWLPYFLTASFRSTLQGTSLQEMSTLLSFLTIGIAGAIGCIVGGIFAEKIGKVRLSMLAMAISAACCLIIGFTFEYFWLTVIVSLIWGMSVIADSGQFSAAVTEFAESEYVGTALTFQMAIGFLLTTISIYIIPVFVTVIGWQWVFLILAIGPFVGIVAMNFLRREEQFG